MNFGSANSLTFREMCMNLENNFQIYVTFQCTSNAHSSETVRDKKKSSMSEIWPLVRDIICTLKTKSFHIQFSRYWINCASDCNVPAMILDHTHIFPFANSHPPTATETAVASVWYCNGHLFVFGCFFFFFSFIFLFFESLTVHFSKIVALLLVANTAGDTVTLCHCVLGQFLIKTL